MTLLQELADRDLAGKILLLDEWDRANRAEVIPDLLAFYSSPGLDTTLRGVTGDTLRSLLARSEVATVTGLGSPDAAVRKLCVHVATTQRFSSAYDTLARLAERETSPPELLELLAALVDIAPAPSLGLFRRHACHDDPFVAALAVEALGTCGDRESIPFLKRLVQEAEAEDRYHTCQVATEKAIAALGVLCDDDVLAFLASKIHHRNPTARRFLHEQLVHFGSRSVPHLAAVFERGDVDEKILAANLFGLIGDRKGADFLVSAMDRGAAGHPNIRFAIYEALGGIASLKSVVCLFDGMGETEDMTLLAVASSLDRQLNPGIVGRVLGALRDDGDKRKRFLHAAVLGRALNLFDCVYGDEELRPDVLDAIRASRDPETVELFRERLRAAGTEQAAAEAQALGTAEPSRGEKKLLAVDDSRSMLLFYRGVAAGEGFDVTTAANGREALDLIESGETFDVIITDLNMPVMDGIDFTRRARTNFHVENTPILMATTESEGSQKVLALGAGVTDFLQKPLRPDLLAQALRAYGKSA